MRNDRKVRETWVSFCAEHNLLLEKRDRKYLHGMTIIHSTKEVSAEYEIEYFHRYELPDTGVRPEELSISLISITKRFQTLSISKAGFISRLFGARELNINPPNLLSRHTLDRIQELVDHFDAQKIEGKQNMLRVKFGEFPNSALQFSTLRIRLIELVNDLTQRS